MWKEERKGYIAYEEKEKWQAAEGRRYLTCPHYGRRTEKRVREKKKKEKEKHLYLKICAENGKLNPRRRKNEREEKKRKKNENQSK